ncbi:MAG TPA: B12-binding domain-containing radical SAM protein, partial [Gammaproteobacteria bacterium]|nr:B12-binding domain-containing radical SAM protein [Gammaproteobacteria bacterium]
MKLTLIYPAIGHRAGESYIRSWQMEPLPIAVLAGLTPGDVDVTFFDDRMESIAYDAPTDAVAIPIETYTATRAYQIASEFRRRGIPVVMGGFHATLVPEEVSRYAEAIVIGEAEAVWPQVIDDLRHGTLQRVYRSERPPLSQYRVDRRLFAGKRYLPIGLI